VWIITPSFAKMSLVVLGKGDFLLKRKQLEILSKWHDKPNRKPLIIRGARQVGKSTLVQLFAEQNGLSLTSVNLERYPDLSSVFKTNSPTKIVDLIEALPNTGCVNANSLLFLDEIQAIPEAIPTLRYFYEEMQSLAVVAAGSLLEFVLTEHKFSMPVGRIEYLNMGPMTFTEFLHGIGEEKLASFIWSFNFKDKIEDLIHTRLMQLLRTYFFVGGMPEAVKTYATTHKIHDASEVHTSIIETYRQDFPKYKGPRSLARIQNVFNFSARHIGKKVKYSAFSPDDKTSTIKSDIDALCMARVLTKVIHSNSNGLPLQADMKESVYKLLFLDVGLMNTICGLSWQSVSAMTDQQLVNEGSNAEQFIGQHLLDLTADTPNRQLCYWLREGRKSNAEVDYVIANNGKIIPIEVKSGLSGSLKSLHQFMGEKKMTSAVRFDANQPSKQVVKTIFADGKSLKEVSYLLYSLPLYLVERLNDFVATEFF
jgi:predicted AAA+ superfamily ATPase